MSERQLDFWRWVPYIGIALEILDPKLCVHGGGGTLVWYVSAVWHGAWLGALMAVVVLYS